jgi:toxin CptA
MQADYKSDLRGNAVMLRIRIGKSRQLAAALLVAHATAAACLAVSFPPGLSLPGISLIAASAAYHLRRSALQRAGEAVVELVLRQGGGCELTTLAGASRAGQVQGSTFVSPWLTVINVRFETGQGRRSVVLAPDCADADALRELRVWLRFRCHRNPQASNVP